MKTKNGRYENIAALAREDAKESRIVYGGDSASLTERWYYTLAKWVKIISFAVVLIMSLLLHFSIWNELSGLPENDFTVGAIAEMYTALKTIGLLILFIITGFSLTFARKNKEPETGVNIFGAILVFIACAVSAVYIYFVMSESDSFYDGGSTAYIWRHLIPCVLLGVSAVANAFLAHFEKRGNTIRYEMVLSEAYDAFKEIKQDESYTEEEWEDFLSNYTRPAKAYPLEKKKKDLKK